MRRVAAAQRALGPSQRVRRLALRFAAALALSAAPLVLGCERCRREPSPAELPAPPPARPKTLAAEFVVADPGAAWRALRPLFGAPAALLPAGPELALGAALDLGPLAAGGFDLARPVTGGWIVRDGSPALGTAIPLSNGAELVARLTTGASARHRVEKHGELEFLLPSATAPKAAAMAVVADALLVGERSALTELGPYLGRVASRKPASGAPRLEAEPRALASLARALWANQRARLAALAERTRQQQGRPADFADPAAVLAAIDGAIDSALAGVEAAKATSAELGIAADHLTVEARLTLADAPPQLPAPTAGTHELGELPPSILAAYWSRRDPESPGALGLGRFARSLFGARLAGPEAALLDRIEQDIESARGDRHTLASTRDFTLLWTGSVKDPVALRRALGDAVGMLTKPPFREPLVALFGTPRVVRDSPVLVEGHARCDRYRFHFTTKARAAPNSPELEAVVLVEPERFFFGIGRSAGAAVAALVHAHSQGKRLGTRPDAEPALARIDPGALFAAYADLSLAGGPRAPVVASGHTREAERVRALRLELSDRALETLVRWGITP